MNREKLAKIAMLMTSPEKEEAHTALKIANKLLKENDLTWIDVISSKSGSSKSSSSGYKRKTQSWRSKGKADRLLVNAEIAMKTEKACFVEATLKNGEEVEVWFPKSQMELRSDCVYISSWIEIMKNKELKEQGHDSELNVL